MKCAAMSAQKDLFRKNAAQGVGSAFTPAASSASRFSFSSGISRLSVDESFM